VPLDQGVLAAVEAILAAWRAPVLDDLPPLHGGIMGYLGYDVVREVEHLPDVPPDDVGHPDAVLAVIGQLAAYDHWRQRVSLIDNVLVTPGLTDAELDERYDAAVARLEQLAADGTRAIDEPLVEPPDPDEALPEIHSRMGSDAYRSAVEVAKEHILAGDIFQVVLAQRFDLDLDADPFDVYRVLRQVNPSPYMYFLRQPGLTLVGSSPEPMVQLLDGTVISRPIAGTRRRGRTDEEDRRLGAELIEHPKERAEHVMLIDLARNDVGRVVEYGTEKVDEMMTLERYSHVMHLTSQVSGRLRAGRTAIDVLRATLPAGTVSGAPKVRAMEIIDELEPTKRGPYAGVVGYLDFSGNIDTAITIRTMVVDDDGHASVQAGAGIVVDSVPEHEDLECHNKARALLAAVPAARRMTAARRRHAREGGAGGR
jgi:anthranilate synthase component 1